MKVAVIGAGVWGRNLVANFSNLGVLTAVVDIVDSNRKRVSEKYPSIPIYRSIENLFDNEQLDAVAIATPADTHYAIAIAALEKGLDVFVEKPMTLDPREAEDLHQFAQQHDRILMVGHMLLYQPSIGFIKKYLKTGQLGKLYTLTQRRSKLGRVRAVENALWSFGVHDIAVLLYLTGEDPKEVHFFGHSGIQEKIEDDTHLHLTFPSGVKANLHNSWLWPRTERELIITGENGILVFDETSSQVILHKKTVSADLSHHDSGQEVLFQGTCQPLRLELEHFLTSCQKRQQPLSDGAQGAACVRVLAQASNDRFKS